jgi:hypothetical protein
VQQCGVQHVCADAVRWKLECRLGNAGLDA